MHTRIIRKTRFSLYIFANAPLYGTTGTGFELDRIIQDLRHFVIVIVSVINNNAISFINASFPVLATFIFLIRKITYFMVDRRTIE